MNWRSACGLAALSCVFLALLPSLSRANSSGSAVNNGRLTIIANTDNSATDGAIATIGPNGVPHLLYRPKGCCELFGLAWSPKGRRLAYSLTCVGCGLQALRTIGIHVVNLATGKDVRILPRYDGFDLDWSRRGSRLAFVLSGSWANAFGSIYVAKPDGTGKRMAETGTSGRDTSPSFSPAAGRIAFATLDTNCNQSDGSCIGSAQTVSIADTDGSHRRLLAAHATAPAWSPNGRLIAVRALGGCSGIRLLTPAGADATPGSPGSACHVIGIGGTPIWSPNGRKIAIQTTKGIYVMNANGSGLKLATTQTGAGVFWNVNPVRPTWRPA